MRFAGADHAGVAVGELTIAFRRWQTARVTAGRVYRTAAGRVLVPDIRAVRPADVTDADARAAGRTDAADPLATPPGDLGGPLWRIEISLATDPDPGALLAADDDLHAAAVAAIRTRLDRLDKASSYGPRTRATLAAIGERPGVRAPDLAASFGRDTAPFELDVRKLKNPGLTHSLRVGYELSPRGRAFLRLEETEGSVMAPHPQAR